MQGWNPIIEDKDCRSLHLIGKIKPLSAQCNSAIGSRCSRMMITVAQNGTQVESKTPSREYIIISKGSEIKLYLWKCKVRI